MKNHMLIGIVRGLFVLLFISIVSGNANAIPITGNYSLADGVYREVLVGGSAGQVSNVLHFHDGILSTDPSYYGWTFFQGSNFVISQATTLVGSGANYDTFKTYYTAGILKIDGEIWGESNSSFYNIVNASAEISTTIFSNGNIARDLLVFGAIDGYSNYNALFNATAIETGNEPWFGYNSTVGKLQDAKLEIAAMPVPEPSTMLLLIPGILVGRFFKKRTVA